MTQESKTPDLTSELKAERVALLELLDLFPAQARLDDLLARVTRFRAASSMPIDPRILRGSSGRADRIRARIPRRGAGDPDPGGAALQPPHGGPARTAAPERAQIATIVVCEGDGAALDLLCNRLVKDPLLDPPARDAADALRPYRYNRPHILVLDLALQGETEALKFIREPGDDARIDQDLPVIVLAGRGAVDGRARGLELGADDYVRKPFRYKELRARIDAVLRRLHSRQDSPVRVGEIHIDRGPSQGHRRRT